MNTNNRERFCRHGDVYIFDSPVSAAHIRRAGKRIYNGVLARGESTGHKHELLDDTAYERYELDGKTFLIVSERGVSIAHEEHGVGVIGTGMKEVIIDREYDYLAEMQRRVAD